VRKVILSFMLCTLLAACAGKAVKPTRPVAAAPQAGALVPPVAREAERRPWSHSFVTRLLAIANNEWEFFGQQRVVYTGEEESIPHVGYWEDDDYERIDRVNNYWRAVGSPGLSGRDCQQPWSAAFISWLMQAAGVAEEYFPPAKAHWVYLSRIVSGAYSGAPFLPRTLSEYKPKPGDLICASRDDAITPYSSDPPTPELLENSKLHCDLVVKNDGRNLEAIGGNVRNSVSKSFLTLSPDGYVVPTQRRRWFMIVENRLD
jgi:hypothetical protein